MARKNGLLGLALERQVEILIIGTAHSAYAQRPHWGVAAGVEEIDHEHERSIYQQVQLGSQGAVPHCARNRSYPTQIAAGLNPEGEGAATAHTAQLRSP